MGTKSKAEFEIAHVLFIDTVGYSKLSIVEQREWLDTLNRLVRSSERFRAAEVTGELIRLPTGDGMVVRYWFANCNEQTERIPIFRSGSPATSFALTDF